MRLHLKIRYKIALVLNAISIGIILSVSILLYQQFESALQERILLQLSSIRNLKSIQIENLIDSYVDEMKAMSEHLTETDYLDALADDDFVRVDSILISRREELVTDDTNFIEDLSLDYDDGRIHLAYHFSLDSSVFHFFFTPDEMQGILFEHTGMGQTGETYIVGEDHRLRTVSRFFPEKNPVSIVATTQSVKDGLEGNSGIRLQDDYRSIPVFSSYAPFNYYGLDWVILSEIDKEEAFLPLQSLKNKVGWIALLIIFFVMIVSYPLSSRIVKPILNMQATIIQLSRGEVEVESMAPQSLDEIGAMLRALRELITAMSDTVLFANSISRGNFEATFKLRGDHDALGQALINMRDQLRAFQAKELNLLKASQRSLIKGEENERKRLARELHDSIGPLLTNLKMEVESFPGTERKHDMKMRIDHVISEVRVITMNLMPSVLKEFGLGEAIANLVKHHDSVTGLNMRYENNVKQQTKIPEEVALTIYRITQEAIHNVLKHAKASQLGVSVTEFNDHVSLFVSDDGEGFDTKKNNSGHGLGNMRERVNIFDGMFTLESGPDGTQIEVEISF